MLWAIIVGALLFHRVLGLSGVSCYSESRYTGVRHVRPKVIGKQFFGLMWWHSKLINFLNMYWNLMISAPFAGDSELSNGAKIIEIRYMSRKIWAITARSL